LVTWLCLAALRAADFESGVGEEGLELRYRWRAQNPSSIAPLHVLPRQRGAAAEEEEAAKEEAAESLTAAPDAELVTLRHWWWPFDLDGEAFHEERRFGADMR